MKPPAHDPAAAKRLLAEAGYPDGFRITLHSPNNRYVEDAKTAQAVAQFWSRIGLDARVEVMPSSVFSTRSGKREFSAFLIGFGHSTGDAWLGLSQVLQTHDSGGTGGLNRGRYSSPAFDALMEQARGVTTRRGAAACCAKRRASPSRRTRRSCRCTCRTTYERTAPGSPTRAAWTRAPWRTGRTCGHDPRRAHGPVPRRRAPGDRRPPAGRRRPFPCHPGAHALRQARGVPVRGHGRGPGAVGARRSGGLLRRARLRRRVPGLPRALRQRRRVRKVLGRRGGRLRHLRLDHPAALVQRAHRHDGPQLRRSHPGIPGLPGPAGAGLPGAGLRRLFRRLERRHAPGRRVRAEAGDLGLQPGPPGAGHAGGPDARRRLRSRGPPCLVHPLALEARPLPRAPRAGVRALPVRAMDPRRLRRVLAAAGHLRPGLARPLRGGADRPRVVVVRPLSPHRDRELRRPARRRTRHAASHLGAMDPRRQVPHRVRGGRVRAGGHAGLLGRGLARVSPPFLRPAPEGPARRGGASGARLRHGQRDSAGRLEHGGHWRTAADWPLPGTRFTPYHLHADGGLRPDAPPPGAAPLSWTSDPANPVPTVGGAITSMEPLLSGGGYDQRERPGMFGHKTPYLPLASRPDVLVFQTEPLPADVVVAGPVAAHLWIASDAPDTDITAKLVDVHPPSAGYPQGFALNLCEGILRCRYREHRAAPRLLEPGVAVPVTVELFPTANLFRAGHRIRLDIAASEFPHYDLNPQTGEAEGAWSIMRAATNTLFMDAGHPSNVVLPLLLGEAG